MGTDFHFGKRRKFWKWAVVMVVQPREGTERHWLTHLTVLQLVGPFYVRRISSQQKT